MGEDFEPEREKQNRSNIWTSLKREKCEPLMESAFTWVGVQSWKN